MNIINKLTLRHLKENKRRTLVTIIGVIISVAMVTGVATLGVSFLDLMKRQTIALDGEWHVKYNDVQLEQISAIEEDERTKEIVLTKDLGYSVLAESKNERKPYLFIKQYNEKGFQQFPISLSEGRLPKDESEIVISSEIKNNAKVDYEIGDQVTIEIGTRWLEGEPEPLSQRMPLQVGENGLAEELHVEMERSFTVVGLIESPTWEPSWAPGYTVINYVDQTSLDATETVDAVVALNKVDRDIYNDTEELASKLNIPSTDFNNELLRYDGVTDNDNLRTTLFSLAGIIMAIVIIGSIALIYNAFAISVSERSRHLGMLASVGATKKQKRNSVFFEGFLIGLISIPIGIASGLVGIGVTFRLINSIIEEALNVTEKLVVITTPGSIIITCGISLATIFISTYVPAQRASKVSAIDAIRQTADVKLSQKTVKTSKFVRTLFGIEAEIGLKNLKRNKRRYQATVFSLVISIVLFLTVSFFTSNLERSIELSQDNIDYDIQVLSNSQGVGVEELQSLATLDHVTSSTMIEEIYLQAWIDESEMAKGLQETIKQSPDILEDGKYPYYVVLRGLDEQSFQAYAEEVGAEVEDFKDLDQPTAIVIDQISYKDYDLRKFIETKSIHTVPGETIDLYTINHETDEQEYLNRVEIAALTDQIPTGVHTVGLGGVDVIVSTNTFQQIISQVKEDEVQNYLYLNSSDPLATQEAIEEVQPSNVYVYNVQKERQRNEQMILLMSVFTYGFIALISAISIANIFNTISTSISLRRREFAMLRSVGMTPKGFNKMIQYESIFYGIKAIVYGLPISIAVMILMYFSFRSTFEYGFILPWMDIIYVIVAIFVIVSLAMLYSIQKVRKQNIIEGLTQENI
ncbi:ABC transporter permease [Halalkalibacter okhensis]|uniref:Cell division protein FtsX n=1 Tax=Halalkalibacter okhensis TaxID=333138 RepID=A0A0B0IGN7_9BACI|nr:ABC transporter permease [Halalkalibacter okhensis]KHF39229.1 cell division protein FtsX [Halalkalibacter okhensis]